MICMKKAMLALALALAMVACATVVVDSSDGDVIGDFEYTISNDTAIVSGYLGDDEIVEIPSTIENNGKDCKVTMIGDGAFENAKFKDVTIPDTVTSIGQSAFSNCPNLQYVTINGSTTIGSNAFLKCSNLSFIDFKEDPGQVDNGAFILDSKNPCTVRSSSSDIINKITSAGDSTKFEHIDANQRIVKYFTSNSPSDELVGFDILNGEYKFTVPDEAKATGYDIAMYDGEKLIDDNYTPSESGDIIVTLVYTYHKYTVDFSVDGTIVQTSELDYKATIVAPADPEKKPDAQYIYKFSHWANTVEGQPDYESGMILDEDHDYHFKAVFTTTLQKYTIEFMVDGKIVKSQVLDYGTLIELPEDPDDKTVEGIDYIFHHWNPYISGMTVTGDVTFTAQFVESDHEYIIKFVVDGQTVKEEKLHYRDEITAPEDPVKEDADGIRYTFTGWEGYNPGMTVTEDATFNAVFSESPVDDGSGSTWIIIVVVVIVVILLALVFLRKFL